MKTIGCLIAGLACVLAACGQRSGRPAQSSIDEPTTSSSSEPPKSTMGPPQREARDASARLQGLEGTLVVQVGDQMLVHNPARAATRFQPASTFKIPNALIALETGVAADTEFAIPWDGRRPASGFWVDSWSQDHTMRTAMSESVLWYFQEIARRIGRERMAEHVSRFAYGNQDIGDRIDRFWLDGPLAISAEEQAAFIQRLYEGRLGLSERTTAAVRDILILEKTSAYTVSGKTGTFRLPSGRLLAWLVGYVEHSGPVIYYALNLDCPDLATCSRDMRRKLVLAILADWQLVPANP